MFTKNDLTDLIWTKLLKIMFLVERTHWDTVVGLIFGTVWQFCWLVTLLKERNKKLRLAVEAAMVPMTSSKNPKPIPIQLWRHPQKNSNPKLPNFFDRTYKSFRIFRVFEQLSSSIGWRGIAFSQNCQGYLLRDLILYQNVVVLAIFSHNFWTRNARKPTEGSKDSDYSL